MAFSTRFDYKERDFFDVKALILSVRFLIINAILALIFLFISLEELDWSIFYLELK